jgi:hypothetical protein
MRLLLAVCAWLVCGTAHGQGMSYLGMCAETWDCKRMMQTWRKQKTIVTGWLEATFADDCKCADRLLADPRDKIVRVHLMNGPCLRNQRCGRYEPFWGYTIAKANRDVKRWNGRVVRRFEAVLARAKKRLESAKGAMTCYVSPCLECDLNETARRLLLRSVSVALPYCVPVDNPYGRKCIRGAVCEKHGPNPVIHKPCIVDLDGVDGRVINVKKWVEHYKHCDLTYYWETWMNCISGAFIDPRKRDCAFKDNPFKRVRGILCRYYSPLLGTC